MDWRLPDVNVGLRGGKTFCAIVCASLIAGSRRAFLFADCVFLCRSVRVLNEIHEVQTFSPCIKRFYLFLLLLLLLFFSHLKITLDS